jgi:hypothetical protein
MIIINTWKAQKYSFLYPRNTMVSDPIIQKTVLENLRAAAYCRFTIFLKGLRGALMGRFG